MFTAVAEAVTAAAAFVLPVVAWSSEVPVGGAPDLQFSKTATHSWPPPDFSLWIKFALCP